MLPRTNHSWLKAIVIGTWILLIGAVVLGILIIGSDDEESRAERAQQAPTEVAVRESAPRPASVSPLVSSLNQAGIAHAERGDYDGAVEQFTKAIELEASGSILYRNRAETYHRSGNYHQAILDYDRAIELDPEDAESHNGRGLSHSDMALHGHAIEDFDSAIDLEPMNATYYGNRASAYIKTEAYDRAVEDYTMAIDLKPDEARFYVGRGVAYSHLDEFGKIIEDFEKALELSSNHPDRATIERLIERVSELETD